MLAPGCLQEFLDRHRRAEEHGPPAGGLGQPQEVHHPGHVDALTQRCGNYGFHL